MVRQSHQKSISKHSMRRLGVMGWIFFGIVMILVFRAFTIQVWQRKPWINETDARYQQRIPLHAKRGLIYDRNFNVLSMDGEEISLAVDPQLLREKENCFAVLGDILGGSAREYERVCAGTSRFVRLDGHLGEDKKQALSDSKLPGLIFMNERKRLQPYEQLGSQVIGVTDDSHQGVGGIEQACDAVLRGEDGWTIYQKDGLNRVFVTIDYPVESPIHGKDVVLTIDHTYQSIVEEELNKACRDHQAKGGSAILMQPFTGEILAMASSFGKIPTDVENVFAFKMQNQAVQCDFEPGSSFKVVAVSCALEEGILEPNSLIYCENGSYQLADQVVRDHDKKYDWLTLTEVLENSSNIGMVKVEKKIGNKLFYQYMRNFGFGNRTGISLPGEVSGILHPLYHWDEFTAGTMAFGQGISVTTLQMACMTSVIANGGELIKPILLRMIMDGDTPVQQFEPQVIRRVISEKTADQMKTMMERVVTHGNGTAAMVDRVPVAGKTGTAQKSIPGHHGYLPGAYVSSFAGFWPVASPQYVLVVVLDEPEKQYWASTSAAPLFSKIVERISGVGPHTWPERPVVPPRAKKDYFIFSKLEQSQPTSKQQEIPAQPLSPHLVPDMRGLSIREALCLLAERNIKATVEGNGVVREQDVPPGSRVGGVSECHLKCL